MNNSSEILDHENFSGFRRGAKRAGGGATAARAGRARGAVDERRRRNWPAAAETAAKMGVPSTTRSRTSTSPTTGR